VPSPAPQEVGTDTSLHGVAEGSLFQRVVIGILRGSIFHFSVGTTEPGGENKKLENLSSLYLKVVAKY